MPETGTKPADQFIVEASTVIVHRNGPGGPPEILMIQRARELSFAGSACVFPGGKVDPADRDLAAGLGPDDSAFRIAAIREVLEETGLVVGIAERASPNEAAHARELLAHGAGLAEVLEAMGWSLALEDLVPFARWLPRFKAGRIFDTWFYLADLGSGQIDLTPDLGESTRLFWTTAADALQAIEEGEIKAIYPTRRNLERLAQFQSFADTEQHARSILIKPISPVVELHNGMEMLRIPADCGYPITVAPTSQVRID